MQAAQSPAQRVLSHLVTPAASRLGLAFASQLAVRREGVAAPTRRMCVGGLVLLQGAQFGAVLAGGLLWCWLLFGLLGLEAGLFVALNVSGQSLFFLLVAGGELGNLLLLGQLLARVHVYLANLRFLSGQLGSLVRHESLEAHQDVQVLQVQLAQLKVKQLH